MKGAIEYLKAVRDICNDTLCDECPLAREEACPYLIRPDEQMDEDILKMVRMPERVKNGMDRTKR